MVEVQQQAFATHAFSSLSEAEKQAALSFLLVSEHDAVIDGAWDSSEDKSKKPSESPSQTPSTPSSLASSRSPSPSTSSLLIRSKHQGWERSFELHSDWPLPKIERDDEVLIEHKCVGLNPVDYKSILYNFGIPSSPWVLGRDIAGIVAQLGSNVRGLQVGDRVWTCADSRDVRSGAYQRYSVGRRTHIGRIPDNVSNEQASTLGTGLVTAAIIAYWFFRWPRDRVQEDKTVVEANRKRHWLLIYGCGAITGIYTAQLARISGIRIIAIASPSNFEYLKSNEVGVDRCIDRYDSVDRINAQVREIVGAEGLAFIVDCVGAKTAALCHDIATSVSNNSPQKTEMICLAGDPKTVDADKVQVHRISFSTTFYGDDHFAQNLLDDIDYYLRTSQLHPARYETVADGLAGVRHGLERLRDNQAPRACKLIIDVEQTPHAHSTNLGVRADLGWNGVV
jgi:NADPH:quinone reductase-like Zn-dependent oxidoreductase